MNVEKVFLRTPYNYDRDQASNDSGLVCDDVTRTKQSFKEECDINTIVRRFGITGEAPQNVTPPSYQAFNDVFDFRSAMHAIMDAEKSFMAMPSDVRGRFQNDPQLFLEFCGNPANQEEMVRMGLAVKIEEPPKTATLDDVVNAIKSQKGTGTT